MNYRKKVTLIGDIMGDAAEGQAKGQGRWQNTGTGYKYVLGPGDTLPLLAHRYMGDASYAENIRALQPALLRESIGPGTAIDMPPKAVATACALGLIGCPTDTAPMGDIITPSGVKQSADLVATQVQGVQHDFDSGVAEGKIPAETQKAWHDFTSAWAGVHQEALDASWLTFSLGSLQDSVNSYQKLTAQWQKQIADLRGKPSAIPKVTTPSDGFDYKPYLIGAGVVVGAWFFLKVLR